MKNYVQSLLLSTAIIVSFLFCSILQLNAQSEQLQTELPLVIVVCSYNNALWVEKNLDSIVMQNYSNYRIVYVDDASLDNTVQLVADYRDTHKLGNKITLIANKERSRKTKNVYNAFHSCQDNEIIVIVDGDDWLGHPDVFSQINQTYLDQDIWLTWGQFELSEKYTRGWAQQVPDSLIASNDFREFTWVYGAPRTFYAWLFKQVKLEDFIGLTVNGYEGKFYPSSDDFAMMYPMLEMAHDHIAFIPHVAYIVNQYNPLSTSHAKPADPLVSMQTACEVKMYKKRYESLDTPLTHVILRYEQSKADMVLISSSIKKTTRLLQTIHSQVKNVGSVLIIHQGSITKYEKIAQQYNASSLSLPADSTAVQAAIAALPHEHILIMHDTTKVIEPIECTTGIIDLERTGALGCYYHVSPELLEQNNIAYQHIRDQLQAWKIYRDSNHIIQEHGCDMSLYRKKDVLELIALQQLGPVQSFEQALPKRSTNLHALGLCYSAACARSKLITGQPFDPAEASYYIADFDDAMYATERHHEIYNEILEFKNEASFVEKLRKNYTNFFKELPFNSVPKIPKIIHHIWLGGTMPEQYVIWRKKWQAMHPDWVFMLWTDKEVAHFSLENQMYYDETTSYGEKANLLRYELLYQFGGLYVDTDCECFKSFDLLHHCCDFYAGCEYPQRSWAGSRVMVGNSIMASRPGHPMVAKFIKNIKTTWHEEMQVARSGTRYATNIIKQTLENPSDVIMIFPANMFYPWTANVEPWDQPVTGQETFVQPETWSLHYWHFTWKPKAKGLNRDLNSPDTQTPQAVKMQTKLVEKKSAKKRILTKRQAQGN